MRNLALSFALIIGLASPAFAEDAKPYSDAKEIDLVSLLPTPPANGSPQMQAELGEILTIQVTRTPEMAARAVADAEEDVWRFADVINNPKFTKEDLPKFAAFFDRRGDGRCGRRSGQGFLEASAAASLQRSGQADCPTLEVGCVSVGSHHSWHAYGHFPVQHGA